MTVTQSATFDLFLVSLTVLLVVLLVLLLLCWILRHNKSRNLTELKLSAGQPARTLTIRTEQGHAQQLLDKLLDRVVYLQAEPGPEPEAEPGAEPGVPLLELRDPLGGEHGSDSGSDPGVSTAASFHSGAVNTLHDKLWKWITVAKPPPATLHPSRPCPPPADQDQIDDLCPQQSDVSQHASLSSQGVSCSACSEAEEKLDESQL